MSNNLSSLALRIWRYDHICLHFHVDVVSTSLFWLRFLVFLVDFFNGFLLPALPFGSSFPFLVFFPCLPWLFLFLKSFVGYFFNFSSCFCVFSSSGWYCIKISCLLNWLHCETCYPSNFYRISAMFTMKVSTGQSGVGIILLWSPVFCLQGNSHEGLQCTFWVKE